MFHQTGLKSVLKLMNIYSIMLRLVKGSRNAVLLRDDKKCPTYKMEGVGRLCKRNNEAGYIQYDKLTESILVNATDN
jgi:hypothetical protein